MALRLKHERDRVLGGIGIGRRRAVALVGGGLAAGWHLWGSGGRATAAEPPPPVRMVTRGPGHHWFGYYDKLQFDPTGRRLLGMQVAFEHRSPRVDDEIRIGMVDLADGDRWLDLGGSRAWSWQQGCMLQWRPGSAHEILWNDRDHDRFVTRLLDVATGRLRTLSRAIYTVAPSASISDGCSGCGPDTATPQTWLQSGKIPPPEMPASGASTSTAERSG